MYNKSMKIYSTMEKEKIEFKPIKKGKINIFVCGPTVYDYPHLGHLKTYIPFDLIVKYLRARGYDVFYLQNITDIDDKIIRRANEKGITPKELATEFENAYYNAMEAVHVNSISKYARATDYIPQIVKQVQTLIEKGYAYTISDGIYYSVNKFKGYGKLSKRTNIEENDSQSRVDSSDEKKDYRDFCLWKFRKENEPYWETELGEGRPGWHIEDTAITETEFGPQYDIHGGGSDLIFPHHEAEIAQMEASSGKGPLVAVWMHIGFLNVESRKMSKSLGNFKTIMDALKEYSYRAIRYVFISNHYRMPLNYSVELLDQANNSIKRIDEFIFNIDETFESEEERQMAKGYRQKINDVMDDDFNSPQAFALIYEYINKRNKIGKSGKYSKDFFIYLDSFLDLIFTDNSNDDSEIDKLVQKREELRKAKNFKEADKIRDELLDKGIKLYDSADGVKWRRE